MVIRASVLGRLLGIRLLRLEADISLVPADLGRIPLTAHPIVSSRVPDHGRDRRSHRCGSAVGACVSNPRREPHLVRQERDRIIASGPRPAHQLAVTASESSWRNVGGRRKLPALCRHERAVDRQASCSSRREEIGGLAPADACPTRRGACSRAARPAPACPSWPWGPGPVPGVAGARLVVPVRLIRRRAEAVARGVDIELAPAEEVESSQPTGSFAWWSDSWRR